LFAVAAADLPTPVRTLHELWPMLRAGRRHCPKVCPSPLVTKE
jgi:hypothetical protein